MKFSREVVIPIVLALLSLIISGYTNYVHNDREVAVAVEQVRTRQNAIEDGQRDLKQDVREIRSDVKDLVKWAYGDKR